MINLISKTDDFIKMINLLNKTGLGRSGHDRSQSFGLIWHVSGPKIVFWRILQMILHHFVPEKLKNQVILTKNLNIWPKIPKIPQKSRKIPKTQWIPPWVPTSPVTFILKFLWAHKGPYGPIRARFLLKKLIILIKNHIIIDKNIKIVNLKILKVKTWFGDKDLFS